MDVISYIKYPPKLLYKLDKKNLIRLSDAMYLKIMYRLSLNKKLNLKKPTTFNEKLQWLKLYDRKKIYTTMVDKYEVKQYVSNIIGKEYIIPTIGIYDRWEDIDFDKLPNQFVIKCTHDSGGVVICKDKAKLDINAARKKIKKSLKKNFYYGGREWPYKNIKSRIIIEQYMKDNSSDGLTDYKVHNFNGIPKLILVCKDRYKESGMTEDFFNEKWHHLGVKRPNKENSKEKIEKPKELKEMLELSKKLSSNIPFIRTDFYVINNKVYFGELTFYPASGFEKFEPPKYDLLLGDWIDLRVKN